MHPIARIPVLFSALVLLAAPAAAETPFAAQGAWIVGGDVFLSRQEVGKDITVTTLVTEVSPQLTYFFADRFGVRATPGLRYFRNSIEGQGGFRAIDVIGGENIDAGSSSTTDEEVWLGVGVGPVYYAPLAERLQLGLGVHLRYDVGMLSETSETSGFGYGAEAGLAYTVGTGGVVELGARYTTRALTATYENVDKEHEYDADDLLLGFRFGVLL